MRFHFAHYRYTSHKTDLGSQMTDAASYRIKEPHSQLANTVYPPPSLCCTTSRSRYHRPQAHFLNSNKSPGSAHTDIWGHFQQRPCGDEEESRSPGLPSPL